MGDNANEILGRIAVASLRKCVEKLTRVSAGAWDIAGVEVFMGSLDETIKRRGADYAESAAIYFDVKGELPFSAILLFDPRDMESISTCFLGRAFFSAPGLTQAGELLLSELGNIILNSFVGALSDAVKLAFLPSAPRCVRGEPRFLLEAIGCFMDAKQSYRIISVRLDIHCAKSVIRSEMLGLIPERLAQELLNIKKTE